MQADLNFTAQIGRLVSDPDVKALNDNSTLCTFSIAVHHVTGKSDRQREDTYFFDVEAWGRLGEIVGQYGAKGRQVSVKGELKQKRWTASDGSKRSRIVIKAEKVQFLGSRENQSNQGNQPMDDGEDIPF